MFVFRGSFNNHPNTLPCARFKDDFAHTNLFQVYTLQKRENNVPFCLKYPVHFFLSVQGMLHLTCPDLPSAYIDCTFILTCSRNVSFSVAVFIFRSGSSVLCVKKGSVLLRMNMESLFSSLMQTPAHFNSRVRCEHFVSS